MRIALGISYRGGQYCGFQRQDQYPSIQGVLEQAISQVANHSVTVFCCGRTDKGVHAFSQVVHFDTQAKREMSVWVRGINANLAPDIQVNWAQGVGDGFHARFSCQQRAYVYVISQKRDLFLADYSWFCKGLDFSCMQEVCDVFLGEHDFYAFQSRHCQAEHAIRRVDALWIEKKGDLLLVHISANAFVHHMVRKIIATLVACGKGLLSKEEVLRILRDRLRDAVPGQAPAKGLFLKSMVYPESFGIPQGINSQLLGEMDV